MTTLADFLLARITEDEAAARMCAEMFPAPWDIADRGWRVRIYAADVPHEDLTSDDPDAMTTRNPVVMEVEPDRHIEDSRWLSERVEHIARHNPARVLAECEAKRRIVEDLVRPYVAERRRLMGGQPSWGDENPDLLRLLAAPYADHPDYDEAWRP